MSRSRVAALVGIIAALAAPMGASAQSAAPGAPIQVNIPGAIEQDMSSVPGGPAAATASGSGQPQQIIMPIGTGVSQDEYARRKALASQNPAAPRPTTPGWNAPPASGATTTADTQADASAMAATPDDAAATASDATTDAVVADANGAGLAIETSPNLIDTSDTAGQ